LPTRRLRIEFYDANGLKHSLSVEGEITRDKVLQLLDYIELMAGFTPSQAGRCKSSNLHSRIEKLLYIISNQFRGRLFTSSQIQDAYQNTFGEPILRSTVSTYLSRLADKGVLLRSGSSGHWIYTIIEPESHDDSRTHSGASL
jgi:hypothetical protein